MDRFPGQMPPPFLEETRAAGCISRLLRASGPSAFIRIVFDCAQGANCSGKTYSPIVMRASQGIATESGGRTTSMNRGGLTNIGCPSRLKGESEMVDQRKPRTGKKGTTGARGKGALNMSAAALLGLALVLGGCSSNSSNDAANTGDSASADDAATNNGSAANAGKDSSSHSNMGTRNDAGTSDSSEAHEPAADDRGGFRPRYRKREKPPNTTTPSPAS